MKIMNYKIYWILSVYLLFAGGCNTEQPKNGWNSPKVLEVEKEFNSLLNSLGGSDSYLNSLIGSNTVEDYQKQINEARALLTKRFTPKEMSELARTCGDLPLKDEEWSRFQRSLFIEMVPVFLQSGDRESLIKLFSTRYPSRYHFCYIEELLVIPGTPNKDPIVILGDAYTQSQANEVRQKIAQAIRRAFKGSGIRGNDDNDFVKKAMQWYEKEKDNLEPNPDYEKNWGTFHNSRYPLFVVKAAAAEKQAITQPDKITENDTKPVPAIVKIQPPKAITNSIGMKMALIPTGEFMMGSLREEKGHNDNEEPPHPVRITKPFWLGVCEVTQGEYAGIVGKNPSSFSPDDRRIAKVPGLDVKRLPVENINWYEAVEFCNRLSKKESLPAYYRLSPFKSKGDWRTVTILGGAGYRLPTEAEWEYACRAGTTTPFNTGEIITETQANIHGKTSLGRPAAVGSYPPNAFGLYDMHGNVAEWCSDAYDQYYYEDCPIDDPPGPIVYPSGNKNNPPKLPDDLDAVVRGGALGDEANSTRSAQREKSFPWSSEGDIGFRVARSYSAGGPGF